MEVRCVRVDNIGRYGGEVCEGDDGTVELIHTCINIIQNQFTVCISPIAQMFCCALVYKTKSIDRG